MSQPSEAPRPLSILQAVHCFGLLLGSLILFATVWQAATLLLALGRHPNSPSCWLRIGGSLPIIFLCFGGAAVLLRGRTAGYFPLYLGIIASLLPWGFPFFPFIPGWTTLGNLLVLFLALVTHLTLRRSWPAKSGSKWPALLRRGGSFAALLLFFVGCLYWQVAIEREAGAFLEHRVV